MDIDSNFKYACNPKESYREFNLTSSYGNRDEKLDDLIEEFRNNHLE